MATLSCSAQKDVKIPPGDSWLTTEINLTNIPSYAQNVVKKRGSGWFLSRPDCIFIQPISDSRVRWLTRALDLISSWADIVTHPQWWLSDYWRCKEHEHLGLFTLLFIYFPQVQITQKDRNCKFSGVFFVCVFFNERVTFLFKMFEFRGTTWSITDIKYKYKYICI